MEEGQGQGGLASSRQYGNALLGVRHQEEEYQSDQSINQSIIYLNQAKAHKNRLDRQGSMRKLLN